MFDIISTSVLGLVVLCLLVITLGIQMQIRSMGEKLDQLLKQDKK